MAEYIERDKAVSELVHDYAYAAAKIIETIPAADVAPVVHGRWEDTTWVDVDDHGNIQRKAIKVKRCSNCCNCFKSELLWKDNYCPNCGAKMDLEG